MYSFPEWGCPTAKDGFLEVLKTGKIIEVIPIPKGSMSISFGRLHENDVVLDHESISRYHAVLQFGPRNSAFIFDLKSTHGSFMNKEYLPSNQYTKISSGNDILSFGGSSRKYILYLAEDANEVPILDKSELRIENTSVQQFFEDNLISTSDLSISSSGSLFTCSFDFSKIFSIVSSECPVISSSGSTKAEACELFFQKSYNFLSKKGLLDKNRTHQQESCLSRDVNFPGQVQSKISKDCISEGQIVSLLGEINTEISIRHKEIFSLIENLDRLNNDFVEDFDVYILNLKKSEAADDIQRKQAELNMLQEVFLFYISILTF